MPVRFRRAFRLAPGIQLNLGRQGLLRFPTASVSPRASG
jgi:hypothetical protein